MIFYHMQSHKRFWFYTLKAEVGLQENNFLEDLVL